MLIEDSKDQKKSIWHRTFPKIGIALLVLDAFVYFCGPTIAYYVGLLYKGRGAPEAARYLFNAASFINANDKHALMAKHAIKLYLPREPISNDAAERNIDAFNASEAGKTELAEKQFRQLMKDYPRFEWPYGNLARQKFFCGDIAEAEQLIRQALAINPDYVNGHRTLANICFKKGDLETAATEVRRALDQNSQDDEMKMLALLLSKKLNRPELTRESGQNVLDEQLYAEMQRPRPSKEQFAR